MTGQKIIDGIIKGALCKAQCADEPSHSCIVVWSSGASEQIEAIIGRGMLGDIATTGSNCEVYWLRREHRRVMYAIGESSATFMAFEGNRPACLEVEMPLALAFSGVEQYLKDGYQRENV